MKTNIHSLTLPGLLLLGVSTTALAQNTHDYNDKTRDNITGSTSPGDPEKSSWSSNPVVERY